MAIRPGFKTAFQEQEAYAQQRSYSNNAVFLKYSKIKQVKETTC